VRSFKVTRIRTVEIMPRGSKQPPPRLTIPASTWALGGLGVVAVGLLALFLLRERNADAPLLLSTNLPAAAASAAPERPPALPVSPPSTQPPQPLAVEPATDATAAAWAVVVVDSPDTDTNLLSRILRAAVKCTDTEADTYARQIRERGQAKVWEGRRADAERIRELLESDDILVRLEAADSHAPPAR
jgi:hypothetical protein